MRLARITTAMPPAVKEASPIAPLAVVPVPDGEGDGVGEGDGLGLGLGVPVE